MISYNTYGLIECRSVNFCGINYEDYVDLLLLCDATWKHNLGSKMVQNKRNYISY